MAVLVVCLVVAAGVVLVLSGEPPPPPPPPPVDPAKAEAAFVAQREQWIDNRAKEITEVSAAEFERLGVLTDEWLDQMYVKAHRQARRERDLIDQIARIGEELGADAAACKRVLLQDAPLIQAGGSLSDEEVRADLEREMRVGRVGDRVEGLGY